MYDLHIFVKLEGSVAFEPLFMKSSAFVLPAIGTSLVDVCYKTKCTELDNYHRPLDIDYQLARDRRELTARMRC